MHAPHLTILEASATQFSCSPAFKLPVLDSTRAIESWSSVSYQSFFNDVESSARYWLNTFAQAGIHPPCAIGFWSEGCSYTDYVHIYGLSRAGFIPQLISLRLSNPEVVYELLEKADAKALVHAPSYKAIVNHCTLPHFPASPLRALSTVDNAPLPPLRLLNPDDNVFIFHTSGSTSGSPKLVPCRASWAKAMANIARHSERPRENGRQIVATAMGSMCHIGQTFIFLGTIQHGTCTVLPTDMRFPITEFVDMVARCGLNRLQQFAPLLANNIRSAKEDNKVCSLLSSLDQVVYSGDMDSEEEEWALAQGFKLRNIFGSTECAAMFESTLGSHPRLLKPMNGFEPRFKPISTSAPTGIYQSTAQLFELIVPSTSAQCPHISLRHTDGDFHTGDLFQEVSRGTYAFRGRDDDWIKSENGLRCDTKAIEEHTMQKCGSLISACVVTGAGRPCPAIFVELVDYSMDHEKLKREIIRRTRNFHARRYFHERITTHDLVFVKPPNTLPRTATKGNIRRKAVEMEHKVQLNEVYNRLFPSAW